MVDRIRKMVARVAAIGAVRRKGVKGLSQYDGKVSGVVTVIRKSGEQCGESESLEFNGRIGRK